MKHLILSTITVLALLICAQDVGAQTITGYQLRVYLTGGGAAPVTTYDIASAAVTCGQPKTPVPTAGVTNPNTAVWDDPANATLDCRWVDNGTGPLFALPFSLTSTYTSRMVAVNAAGASPESLASNSFTRPGQPLAAPVNVRMLRP